MTDMDNFFDDDAGYRLAKAGYKKAIAAERAYARKTLGWSLKKTDAADACAAEWANANQNRKKGAWDHAEWRNDHAGYLAEFVENPDDTTWMDAYGFKE